MANALPCTNLTGGVRSMRLFKIDCFSLVSAAAGEECIKSRWDVGGYEREVHCYPSRYSSKMVVFKLMFLSEAGGTCSVKASLGCLLVHPRVDASQEMTASGVFQRPKGCTNEIWLVRKSSLPAPGCSRDDHLTVQCTITVLKEPPEAATAVPVPSSNLHEHLGELLRMGTGSDVTFLVSSESFVAHKNILAARSPVLMAEFFGHMMETSAQTVVIQDMEPQAFKAMLHFVYTDTVPELDQELEAVATIAQHLLAAANRYGLDRLKVICAGKLAGGISIDTAATTLSLAEQHNCSHLKAKCVDFIVSTPAILDAVVASEGYRHLEASCPSALTSIVISMRGRRN